jgi:hypothetical protein
MDGMTDLVTWMRAQLDAEEWLFGHWPGDVATKVGSPDGINIARWDSTRGLAEAAAKRQLLDWFERTADWASDNNMWNYEGDEALKILALPYADRPGYLDEWRPATADA